MLLRSIGYTKNKKGTIESGINALKIYFTENGIDTEALI
jgi:D-alanyl-D-alanine carboxypeptidase